MRIAIPVDEKSEQTNVCISFGRAPYFLIIDNETMKKEFLDNSAIAATGGAGIKASQTLIDKKVDVVITQSCGENAVEVLNSGDIKIYKAIKGSAMESLKLFNQGKLAIFKEVRVGLHRHGGR